jgi:hypothetical protein
MTRHLLFLCGIMQISYTTTLDDYVEFQRFAFWKYPVTWGTYLLAWPLLPLVFLVGAAGLFLEDSNDPLRVAVALVFAGVGFALAIAYPWLFRGLLGLLTRLLARSRGTRGMVGRITLILSEESLTEITEITRTEARWESMHSVEVAGDYTFIFVTAHLAAIIPRYGFDDDEDYDAVRAFALAHVGRRRTRPAGEDGDQVHIKPAP